MNRAGVTRKRRRPRPCRARRGTAPPGRKASRRHADRRPVRPPTEPMPRRRRTPHRIRSRGGCARRAARRARGAIPHRSRTVGCRDPAGHRRCPCPFRRSGARRTTPRHPRHRPVSASGRAPRLRATTPG